MCPKGLPEGELGVLSWEGTVILTEVGGGRLPPQRNMGVAECRLGQDLASREPPRSAGLVDGFRHQEQRGEDSSGGGEAQNRGSSRGDTRVEISL